MSSPSSTANAESTTPVWQIAALWALVGVPAAWGFFETLSKAVALLTG